ncbi:MAG: DUF1559 domain-containing protein [bacterium]|nr:DUF1559 domain-containing protein [bacterium]
MNRFHCPASRAKSGVVPRTLTAGRVRAAAFTLVELLVVVSIIALLISILLPSLKQAREQGRRAKCRGHLHMVGVALNAYANANGDDTPLGNTTEAQADNTTAWWGGNGVQNMLWVPGIYLAGQEVGRGTALGALYPTFVPDGHIYYCPSYRDSLNASSFEDPTWGFNRWGDESLMNHIAGSYLYRASWRTHQPGYENPTKPWQWKTQPLNLGRDSQRAVVSDGFTPNYWAIGGRIGHEDGYMVGYMDGHVAYNKDPRGREVRRFWPLGYDFFGYAIDNEFAWLYLDQVEGVKLPNLVISLEDARKW